MADPEQVAILKQGVKTWNNWRGENLKAEIDLSGTDLSGADLSGADLGDVDLREANLYEADISGADLSGADIRDAQLGGADLRKANVCEADLRGAHFSRTGLRGLIFKRGSWGADLRGADLSGADLRWAVLSGIARGTKFNNAMVWGTVFADLELRGAKGLDAVVHMGPSHIAIDTIYKSRGKIPKIFFAGQVFRTTSSHL